MLKRKFELENDQGAISSVEKRRKTDCDDIRAPVSNAPARKLVHDDYTVGWICAIKTEYVAAQAFLDEEHDQPEYVSHNDNNDYTLGKVGNHNVVMAVLPNGEYGISSAASVARDMLHSFPNIRIGLMVGIGGGAPSRKHDIRLGDVVVSAPHDGKGGVFQYDLGKTIQDQIFRPTGLLNQPPTVLRAAVSGLEAQYERKGHRLEEAITSILDKNPRLRKKYKRPEPNTDRLYQSGIIHVLNEASCARACGDDPSKLVFRPDRNDGEDNPAIHYGEIASANQLMKDALIRDKLAAERDVLCFEMEAAGLMNHFPCLVIRGICDYSDSHKNKEWQGYAAMVAAAYAKDLLGRIPPNRVEAEKKIADIISGMSVRVDELVHAQHDQTILKWLTPIDALDYTAQQNDHINRRKPGTGQWFLDTPEFQSWVNTDNQTLFCPGIPGAGKTIITSIVIEYLQTNYKSSSIAYLYCNVGRQGQQTTQGLFASILKQLVRNQSPLPKDVKDLYDRHKAQQSRPGLKEILVVLQSVISSDSRTFIIIDALDECQNHDSCRDNLLSEIFTLQDMTRLNIFATSRPQEVEAKFNGSIVREIIAMDKDIEIYLDDQISLWEKSHNNNLDNIRSMIKTEITRAADGMFLLATLNMNALGSQLTRGDIKDALQNIAKGENKLDKAYEQTMKRIKESQENRSRLAERALAWIFHAKRPLSTTELLHALAVKPSMSTLDEDYLHDPETVLSVCAGLVRLDEKSQIIDLVHKTTRDYFEMTKETWFPDAESGITTTCVTYLSFGAFESGFCQTDAEFEERLRSNRLYDYAAHNWGHHARKASSFCHEVMGFLDCRARVEASTQALMAGSPFDFNTSQEFPGQMTGLHLAAYFGVEETVKALLQKGAEIDAKNTYGQTALSYAAQWGHEAVVKQLLEKGADLEAKGGYNGWTALSYAGKNGHEAVVKQLLDKGADLEAKDMYNRTALSYAAKNGDEAVVKQLLDKGADLEAKGGYYGRTALSRVRKVHRCQRRESQAQEDASDAATVLVGAADEADLLGVDLDAAHRHVREADPAERDGRPTLHAERLVGRVFYRVGGLERSTETAHALRGVLPARLVTHWKSETGTQRSLLPVPGMA
ncbi:hypothetical protein DL765_001966 [Monosporascus sp. GIB2]|nr:hypothetical protein DL765_001966 [Monosporascus sp. GIB2]